MPHHYTRTDQVKFLTEWFDSWSELQREDFLPIMTQALNPADHVNGLVGAVTTLRVGDRRPSLFDCQVKLFQDWYENWTPEEKERLMQHFTTADPDFVSKLNKSPSDPSDEEKADTFPMPSNPVDAVSPPSPALAATDEHFKDDGVSPGSHTSSPLSSLSQPLSPHDSGVEENSHSDMETTPSPKPTLVESAADKTTCESAANTSTMSNGNSGREEEGVTGEQVEASVAPGKDTAITSTVQEGILTVTNDIQESI